MASDFSVARQYIFRHFGILSTTCNSTFPHSIYNL
jgi:hypothetical protein